MYSDDQYAKALIQQKSVIGYCQIEGRITRESARTQCVNLERHNTLLDYNYGIPAT